MSDTQNKWVPVSERLPEKISQKLVRINNSSFGITRLAYFTDDDTWRDPNAGVAVENVTHWMDLPEPPEPPKPADPFEAWWDQNCNTFCCSQNDLRRAWNAAKEHYAKPKDYQRGFEDSVIAFESMVNRILEGKEDGTGKLDIPELEKLRHVLLERLKPLPDFETWAKAHCADGPYLAVYWHPITKQLIHIDNARGIWNAAQGKPEA